MSKTTKLSIRSPRRGSKEHDEAIAMVQKPSKYVSFHVRLSKEESKRLKKKLLELDITGVEWIRQLINAPNDPSIK